MAQEQRRYFSYLLRLWQVDGAGASDWRASLEDPHTGERRGFANLESLFAFLKEQTGDGGEWGERPRPTVA